MSSKFLLQLLAVVTLTGAISATLFTIKFIDLLFQNLALINVLYLLVSAVSAGAFYGLTKIILDSAKETEESSKDPSQ